MKFAIAADGKFVYVASEIADDEVLSGEDLACNAWNDDWVEAYIDRGKYIFCTCSIKEGEYR